MLTVFALVMALQQATGGVVWETPAPASDAPPGPVTASTTLPDWALADPFGWERSQCSPLIRGAGSLDVCQARVRAELSAALGDRLPAGLRPAGAPVPCLATPGDDGAYPVQCGTPERQAAATVTPTVTDCRPRPTRQGGSVAFVTDCRAEETGARGLSLNLFGKD